MLLLGPVFPTFLRRYKTVNELPVSDWLAMWKQPPEPFNYTPLVSTRLPRRDVRHICRQLGFYTPGWKLLVVAPSHETALSTKCPPSKLLVFMYSLMRLLSLMVRSECDVDWWTIALELTLGLIHICHRVRADVLCTENWTTAAVSFGEANVSLQGRTRRGNTALLCMRSMTLQINEGKHHRYTYVWESLN